MDNSLQVQQLSTDEINEIIHGIKNIAPPDIFHDIFGKQLIIINPELINLTKLFFFYFLKNKFQKDESKYDSYVNHIIKY